MKIIRNKIVDGVWLSFEDDMTPEEITFRLSQSLSPRQIRLALIQSGVSLSDISNMIAQLPEPDRSIINTLWEYSLSFDRTDENLIQFGAQLGLTDEQLDDLFILGSTL